MTNIEKGMIIGFFYHLWNIAKRLDWANAHKDWIAEDFERVIWSDEFSVEKSKDLRQQYIFREPEE